MNTQQLQTTTDATVGFMTTNSFELSQRVAKMLSLSTIVPKDYQNNISNCIIALNMAQRIGADPLMTMQNLVIVQGRPTWSSQFLIATFNTCGRFSAIRYEFFGEKGTDEYGCRATATELSTGEKLVGTDVTIAIAKSEGWYNRNGSKWKTMPQQMLMYRAAAWFIRAIAPELSMGLHTQEEIIDASVVETIKPVREKTQDLINPVDIKPTEEIEEAEFQPIPNDPYALWLARIEDCQSLSDIAWLLKEMPPNIKLDLKENIVNRQNKIKQQQKENHE